MLCTKIHLYSLVISLLKCIKLTHIEKVGRILSIPVLERRLYASELDTGMQAMELSMS